jgi:GT2 family glycosyltransferase
MFDDSALLAAEAGAEAARRLFRDLAASVPSDLKAIREAAPRFTDRIRNDPILARWFEVLLQEIHVNVWGGFLGKPLPSAADRFLHLLRLGRMASAGIETLATRIGAAPPRFSSVGRGDPLVSIVIVCWNGWEETRVCLETLFQKTRTPSYEVIVVDNGSSDETPQALRAWAAQEERLRFVRSEENLGFSAGNNLGAERARGSYLLFLNNDTEILHRSWLRRLVEALEADPKNGATGQFGVIDTEGEDPPPNHFYQAIFFPGILVPVAWCSGYAILLRREAFEAAGRWRADLYGKAGVEDIHLGYALRRAGWISVAPSRWIPLLHKIGRTWRKPENAAALSKTDLPSETKWANFYAAFGSRRRRLDYALPEAE